MKIKVLFFSPTNTTEKIVSEISQRLSMNLEKGPTIELIDFTLPEGRTAPVAFTPDDIVIVGVPVYAGRVPNILLPYLNSMRGNGALAIATVVYGNRNYDDALIELQNLLELNGFKVVAGAAFIGEHSFSRILAQNRPDEEDLARARAFADQLAEKLLGDQPGASVAVKGNRPYRKYYVPKNKNGEPADIRKVLPKTNSHCIDCKLCAAVCPMGSIDYAEVSKLTGICIKCGACIKKCPVQAKYYDDENYLRHKQELEVEFAARREPELFL